MIHYGKILVVDDVGTDRLVLKRLLESLGYTVECAENGWEALQKAHDSIFDLMLLDLSMPEIDGLEVLRSLRDDPVTRDLPVIVMSSSDSATLAARSLELGAEDFVTKPLEKPLLRVRLKATLERKRLRDIQASQVAQLQQLRTHLEQSNQELKEANLRLQQLAFSDALTGLPNRRAALTTLNQMWAVAQRSGRPFSCILADIDHFKRVNDQYGHDTGDAVLRETALRLQQSVRAGDVVARYGGEEFLILCPDTDKNAARTVAERLRRELSAEPIHYRNFSQPITASFGVAENGPEVATQEQLVGNADLALYDAKGQGRDRVVVFQAQEERFGGRLQPHTETAAPSPLNDPVRLRTLEESGLLNSPPEETFDRFTRLAGALLRAPVSLMSLVSEGRQFVKSQHGLASPLSQSFCQRVVESGAPVQVPDSNADGQVRASQEGRVQAYLGVPLTTETGETLGCFCVLDHQPRCWSPSELETLQDLASALMSEVELRLSVVRERRMLSAYREAREAAEKANQAKSQFLASASHELRNPLNGIIGMCELIRGTPLTEEQREYVGLLRTSADSLLELVNDILDLSKIESGRFELRLSEFDLRETLAEQLKPLALRAAQEGLTLVLDVAPEVPDRIEADAGRLRQIIANLVGNSLKFTSRGSIAVLVNFPQPDTLKVEVHDTGIGIPEDKLNTVFEAFSQVNSAATRHIPGTGLGLAIVRRLVHSMGGQIYCESQLGKGSRFCFQIQVKAVAPPLPRPLPARVLAWIPDPAHQRALQDLLQACACSEAFVTGRREEFCQRVQPGDAVILQVDHNEERALDLLSQLRQQGEVTALAFCRPGWEPSPAWQFGGLQGRINWPLSPGALLEALQRAPSSPVPAPSPPPEGPRLRVLVLEDNRVNQKVIRAMLERMGHRVTVTDSGPAALELLARSAYDLALVDIQMPEMDGLEFAARLREREGREGGHQLLVALTAQAMAGDQERCLQAGMDAYLSKPITLSALQSVLGELLTY